MYSASWIVNSQKTGKKLLALKVHTQKPCVINIRWNWNNIYQLKWYLKFLVSLKGFYFSKYSHFNRKWRILNDKRVVRFQSQSFSVLFTHTVLWKEENWHSITSTKLLRKSFDVILYDDLYPLLSILSSRQTFFLTIDQHLNTF